ncbi:FKBP-type peptidyl-prolyl cis-trans isomerase [Lachnospiraceae bacterium YSD2013]|nr:FKBP-type peptidyl-prolyl cis-trans isomerase [Lachnospiraceae bacterium YSD2013]
MNEEFNESVETEAQGTATEAAETEVTDTTEPALNGAPLEAEAPVTHKKGLIIAIAVASVALIAGLICVVIFLLKKPATDDRNTVSTTNETSVSEEVASTGESVSDNESVSGSEPSVPDFDFSAQLTEEGFIKGADLSSVKDLNLMGMEIPYGSVTYIDDKVNADLLEAASNYAFYDDNPELTVQNGNTINLNYSGSIDGVKFDGGTAEYQTLTIGSGQFIDNFEEQLIGAHPGDDVTVTVTFPEDYHSADLAGKEAVFECKVNSIYKTPEVNDEFVQKYLNDFGSNLEEVKAYIKEQGVKSNIQSYIANYISSNAEAYDIPADYLDNMKNLVKYTINQQFEEYKTYMVYYGYYDAANMTLADYTGLSDEDYETYVADTALEQVTLDLTYESIFKSADLTISDDDYNQIVNYYGGEDAVNTYGKPYILQTAIKYSVISFLEENAHVIDEPQE